jgi:hypothetical protein
MLLLAIQKGIRSNANENNSSFIVVSREKSTLRCLGMDVS